MTATTRRATPATVDPARASYLRSEHDEARGMTLHTLSYLGNGATYEVAAYADGSDASCTCPSFTHSTRRPKWCKHCDHFIAMLEQVEYERQAGRKTWELQADERWFMGQDNLGADQRRAINAIRAVLRARGVRSLAAVARGRQAASELFDEAS